MIARRIRGHGMRLAIAAVVAFGSGAGLAVAGHDTDLTRHETLCQARTINATRTFLRRKIGCLRTCERGAFAGQVAPADCVPPYAGETARCVAKKEETAVERQRRGSCARDCPECYAGGDCAAAGAGVVARVEAAIDLLAPLVYCDDAGSPNGLTRAEHLCQDKLAGELARFAVQKFECLRDCLTRAHGTGRPLEGCTPPLAANPVADPTALACVARWEARARDNVEQHCGPGAQPACHGGRTAAGWVALVEVDVDVEAPNLLCGSASGAFLD